MPFNGIALTPLKWKLRSKNKVIIFMTVTFFLKFAAMHHNFSKIWRSNRVRLCIVKKIRHLFGNK